MLKKTRGPIARRRGHAIAWNMSAVTTLSVIIARGLRRARGSRTRRQIAECGAVSESTIAKIEAYALGLPYGVEPRLASVQAIIEACDVTVEHVLELGREG